VASRPFVLQTSVMEASKDEMARRLDAFVDAAFAFAVTLLIVGGGDTPERFSDLSAMLLRAPAFAAAFALIAMFWLGYRDLGRLWPHRDGLSTALSLAIVFVVLLYVFPLRFIMEAALHALSGGWLPGTRLAETLQEQRYLYVAYGAGCLILSVLYASLYRHHRGQGEPTPDRDLTAAIWIGNWSILAGVSGVSMLLAAAAPDDFASWAPGVIYMVIGPLIGLSIALRFRRRAGPKPLDSVDTGEATS
jgi:uncharacterized membrane protein